MSETLSDTEQMLATQFQDFVEMYNSSEEAIVEFEDGFNNILRFDPEDSRWVNVYLNDDLAFSLNVVDDEYHVTDPTATQYVIDAYNSDVDGYYEDEETIEESVDE